METSQYGGGWGSLKIIVHDVTFLLRTYFSGIHITKKSVGEGIRP